MSSRRPVWLACLASAFIAWASIDAAAQSFNGAITGVVRDSTGGVVADTALTLRNIATDQTVATAVSGADGEYAFRNLAPGKYAVTAVKDGFQQVTLNDLVVPLSTQVRADVTLPVGGLQDRVEVTSGTSVLNTTATQEHGITPETLQQLPLLMNSGPRAAAGFAILMPGVSTGGGSNAFDARINGGLQSGDEATVDGVSMQQGFMSQGGMVSIFQDFPMSPDMVSEVKVLTSNYAPEYGSSTSGQIMAVTRSGGSSFHGAGFIYHRDDSLKGTQWGADSKPAFNRNNYGANIGGPGKLPGLWNDKVKSFFFFNYEGYRQTGGSNAPTLSIPSLKERNGDFTDWRDSSGNLIPIYDPATLRPDGNGGFVKDQFMGCDGRTPNVICPSRINPIVRAWLDALPNPTSDGPLNNYLGPAIPDTILGNSDYYLGRYDLQFASSDHLFASFWHQRAPAKFVSTLPQAIANETYSDPQNSWVNRFNWDRTFSGTLLNHMSMGYLNRNEGYGSVNQELRRRLPADRRRRRPQRAAAACVQRRVRPVRQQRRHQHRQHHDAADLHHQRHGHLDARHPHPQGGDGVPQDHGQPPPATATRRAPSTSAAAPPASLGVNSGSPIASFLLGAVDNGNVDLPCRGLVAIRVRPPGSCTPAIPGGSTTSFTLDYGLRWDYYSPSSEKYDRFSFFDPIGANPGAGGRPGPPRLRGRQLRRGQLRRPLSGRGLVRRLRAAPRRRLLAQRQDGHPQRLGHLLHPGVLSGLGRRHLAGRLLEHRLASRARSAASSRRSTWIRACRRTSQQPPDIRSDYRNGQGILYRPLDANERSYAHQWNISVDRELGANLSLSVAYVGSAGRRLPSSIEPLNAIDPAYLSLGDQLNDEFQPGMTSLDGVRAAVSGLGRADDRLRAVGGAGAPPLSRSTATTCRA